MQPNYKDGDEIQKPAQDSSKLTNRNKKFSKVKESIQMMGKVDPFSSIDAGDKKQKEEQFLNALESTTKTVENLLTQKEQELVGVQSTHNVGDTFLPDEQETSTRINVLKDEIDRIKKSAPGRVHSLEDKETMLKVADMRFQKVTSDYIQQYGRTPDETLADPLTKEKRNSFADVEEKDAVALKSLNELFSTLKSTKENPDYWENISWEKSVFEQNPEKLKSFFDGFQRDITRSIFEGIGISAHHLPLFPEGRQWYKNKLVIENAYDKLPEDSVVKKDIKDGELKFLTTMALMDETPKERPFWIEAIKTTVSSFAALPLYAYGLGRLGLITKTGESGLQTLGLKQFGINLLKSPFYTQPIRLANDSIDAVADSDNFGDAISGMGKVYLNGLAEVIGEVSTPILAKGLSKFKGYNIIKDFADSKLTSLANKVNLNVKFATDWLLLSPLTETFEEEISNALSFEPSIFSADFDLKRLTLEALSSLGMGIGIGVIQPVLRNRLENKLVAELPEQYKDNQTALYQKLDELTNGILDYAQHKLQLTPKIQEKINEHTEDMDIDAGSSSFLQKIRETFGTQPRPDDVTLPMAIENENKQDEFSFKNSKVQETVYHGTKSQGFNYFSKTALKTGEGANAYGEGFYFASNRATAHDYAFPGTGGFLPEENVYEPDFTEAIYKEAERITPYKIIYEEPVSKEEFAKSLGPRDSIEFVYSRGTTKKTTEQIIDEKYKEYVEKNKQGRKEYDQELFYKNVDRIAAEEFGAEIFEVKINLQNPIQTSSKEFQTLRQEIKNDSKLTKELKKRGYDGVIHESGKYGDTHYVVFDSTQIFIVKSNLRDKITEVVPDEPFVQSNLSNQQTEVQQINTDTIVDANQDVELNTINLEQLEKISEQQDTTGLNIKLSDNGILKALRDKGLDLKVHGLDTPAKMYSWVQSFKTGNMEMDWIRFEVAWKEKFLDTFEEPTRQKSNRTLLQDVFVTYYFTTKTPSVILNVFKPDSVNIIPITGDSYLDADNKQKSLFTQEELWEKLQGVLPQGTQVYKISLINFLGKKFNNFGDIKSEIPYTDIRNALFKSGYYWMGILPNSNTSLVVDIRKILPQYAQKNSVDIDKAYGEIDSLVKETLLGKNLNDLAKVKRIKAITGESPNAFAFPDVIESLRNTTEASAIYFANKDGKTQINYKYVVLDASTIPGDFESEIGDGEEYITPKLAEVIWNANGTPYFKRGAIKPKYFDLGVFWKWARKIAMPKSKLAYFMRKNNIAGIVFSSAIKVGKVENMISWNDINTMKYVPKTNVYEHDVLKDSHLQDKGKIARKAAGAGPNLATTGIMHFMSKTQRESVLKWLQKDFTDVQDYFDKLLQDPVALREEIVNYVNDLEYADDITYFIKWAGEHDNLMRVPSVIDFVMKGVFKDKIFEAARHYKKGSSPAFVLDTGPLAGYNTIENVNKEAFDEKGYLKSGYILLDYFTAKRFNYKIGDKVIVALNPPGAPVDIRAEEIAGILPKEITSNQFVGSVKSYQDMSGKDGDIDTSNVLKVSTDLDVEVWKAIKSLNMEEKFSKMMEDFKDYSKARNILLYLYPEVEPSQADIRDWAKIAPLVNMNGNDGVFALNTDLKDFSLKDKAQWNEVQKLSKEGLINRLYNWKAMYSLFLENDYELDGVKANPDVEFVLPMLKVLTDMALDWTKSMDIAKIKFNWEDLVHKMFIFPEVTAKAGANDIARLKEEMGIDISVEQATANLQKNAKGELFERFNKRLNPIRTMMSLISLRDRNLERYDYIKYYEAITLAKKELSNLPPGLEQSILGITADGLSKITLPKFAMTLPQITSAYNKLKYTLLQVSPDNLQNAQRNRINGLMKADLGASNLTGVFGKILDVLTTLSNFGIYTNNINDELKKLRTLQEFTIWGQSNAPNYVLTPVWFNLLDKIMDSVIFKIGTIGHTVTIGTNISNGYRFTVENDNNEPIFTIHSVQNGKITDSKPYTDWRELRRNMPTSMGTLMTSPEFLEIFKRLISTSNNSIAKQTADDLLNEMFPRIVSSASFNKLGLEHKKSFYYGVLGILDGKDWGFTVQDKPGLKSPFSDTRFQILGAKERVKSYAKAIAILDKHAWKDDVALEILVRIKRSLDEIVGQELAKENDIQNPEKRMLSTIVPLPDLSFLQKKKITMKDVESVLGMKFETESEYNEYINTLLQDNIKTEQDKEIFTDLVKTALSEASKKYKAGMRTLYFRYNPVTSNHTIPFDFFVDIFSKKNKLYGAQDVVYSYPINGSYFGVTANEIDIKFRHWSPLNKAKLISTAQIWWYVQDSIDRHHELNRIDFEKEVQSVSEFTEHNYKGLPFLHTPEAIVHVYNKAFSLAESPDFKVKLVGFDYEQPKEVYYEWAKRFATEHYDIRTFIAAMRYRYLFDVVAPTAINNQIKNMELIRAKAINENNLSGITTTQTFIEQLRKMKKQIQGQVAYMPHSWDSKAKHIEAVQEIYILEGKSPEEALKNAKMDYENLESKLTHIGGTGQVIDVFFLRRRGNMTGYSKSPEVAKRYFNILNRLLRFQHLYAMEELMDDLLKDEIPFMYKHAKEMSAILRGADKYGIKVDINKLKQNDLVIFNTGEQLIAGRVSKIDAKRLYIKDGESYSKNQVSALRKLHGVTVESRARILANNLGLDVKADSQTLPTMMQYILKLNAASMLTSNTFALRNYIGGKIQEFILFGRPVMAQATEFLSRQSDNKLTEEEQVKYNLIYNNSVAVMGNLSEIMGKFNGVVNVLQSVRGIPTDKLDEMIRLGQEWNDVKSNPNLDYNLDGGKGLIRLNAFWNKFVKFANLNFLGAFKESGNITILDPASGEKSLRFHTAVSAAIMHTGENGLDVNDPYQKKLLIAFIDQALRNTQFLYRVGLDQGIWESSPVTRALWTNYKHYPVSSMMVGFYYLDNWRRQRKYQAATLSIEELSDYSRYSGEYKDKKALPVTLIIGDSTIKFPSYNYAKVGIRMLSIGLLTALINKAYRVFANRLSYAVPLIGDVMLYMAGITSTSYTHIITDSLFNTASAFLSLPIKPDDDDKLMMRFKKMLFLTQQEYMKEIKSQKDKKWITGKVEAMLKDQYFLDLVNDITYNYPMGVGEKNAIDGLLIALITQSFLPENYIEWGIGLANTIFPLKLLRSPIGNYALGYGYNPVHTKKIQYDKTKKGIVKPKLYSK